MHPKFGFLALGAALLGAPAAWGLIIDGRVSVVHSPTRFTVEGPRKETALVELAHITVPKAARERAVALLQRAVLNHKATVEWYPDLSAHCAPPKPCPKRGKMTVGGNDINLLLISAGFAHHNKEEIHLQSTSDRALYRETEDLARQKRRGIWRAH